MSRSSKALRIPFVAETAAAIRSVKQLDQAIDGLDASARAAQEAFKRAGDSQALDGVQDSVDAAERAMRQLGIKSEQVANNQIAHLRQAFEALKTSGAGSVAEIARAYENMQNRIQRINAQVGRGVDGLGNHYRTLGLRSVESAKQQVEAAQRAYEAIRNSDAGPEEVARAHAAMQAQIKQINASIGVDIRELEDHYRALGVTSVEAAKKQAEAARQAAQAIKGSKDASPDDIARSQEAANEKIRQYYAALGMDVRTLEEHYQALGVTSRKTADQQIEAARRSYEAVANSDAPLEDVARAYEAMQEQIRQSNAAAGRDVRTLEDHYKSLGVTSIEAAKKQAEAARQAAEAIRKSKDASPEDKTRADEAANEKIRQYYAALGMDVRTLEELYKSLGITSAETAKQQIDGARRTYEAIANSDAPIEDVKRAWEAYQAEVRSANASIGKDVRTLEDHYRELGVVSEAAAAKQIAGIRETANVLRASASGPKEIARITAAEGEKIKAVYTSIGVHAKKTFEEMAAQTRQLGEGMRSIGSSMSWKITAPIMLGFGGGLKVAGDFQKSMNAIRATARDMSEKEFKDLNKQVRDIGESSSYSANQTAVAAKILTSAGVDAQTILGGALKTTVDVAATSEADLETSAKLITQASKLFGVSAKNLGNIANDVAGFMDASKFTVQDLSQAIAQGGGAAKNAKVNFQEFAAVLSMLEDQGFESGSDAGTSMKSFFIALTKQVGNAEEAHQKALKRLAAEEKRVAKERLTLQSKTGKARAAYAKQMRGIDQEIIAEVEGTKQAMLLGYTSMNGSAVSIEEVIRRLRKAVAGMSDAQRDNFLVKLFGTDGYRTALALLNKGVDGYLGALATVRKGDAASAAAIRKEGFKGSLEELSGALEELALTIADSGILETVTGVVKAVTGFIKSLSETSPGLLKFATYTALAAAAIGPLLMGLGQMAIGAAIVMKALSLLLPILGGITLIGAGWAIAIGLAIGAVVATIWIYRDQIITTFGDLMRWMQEYAGEIGKWALRIVAPLVALIWENRDAIVGALSAMLDWIYETFGPIIDFFAWVGKGIFTVLFEPFQDITRAIRIFINTWRVSGYSFLGFWQGIGGALYAWLIEPWERWYKRGKALLEWMMEAGRKAGRWFVGGGENKHGAPGYASGGYTGNVGIRQIAGYVHGREFVLRAAAVRQYPRAMLEQMNRGTWRPEMALAYADTSGRAGMSPVNLNIGGDTIQLYGDRPNVSKLLVSEARKRAARHTQRVPEL